MIPHRHHRTAGERDRSCAGFTLLELAVVLGILGAVLALALPAGRRSLAKPGLEAASARFAATLRLAHAQAIRTNEDQFVTVDPDTTSFLGPSSVIEHLPSGVTLVVEEDGLEWEDRKRLVRFRPDGTATGAVFALSSTAGRSRVVLDALTGRVQISPERP